MKASRTSFIFHNWKIIVILFLPVQWFFFSLISSYPQFIENWYSNGLFRFLSFLMRGTTNWIPFSIGEILLYIIIVFVIFRLILGTRKLAKKQIEFKSYILKFLIGLLAWASVIYFLFMILWGLNYHREPLVSFGNYRAKSQDFKKQDFKKQDFEKQDFKKQDYKNQDYRSRDARFAVYENKFSTKELIGLCEQLIEGANRSRNEAIQGFGLASPQPQPKIRNSHIIGLASPQPRPKIRNSLALFGLANSQSKLKIRNSHIMMGHDEIIEQAYSGFHNIIIENKRLDYKIPSVKKILFTDLFSFLGVGGIYNPFTGEANVNMGPPDFLLPATVCHEMAHQAGIAPEDEANYVAYIVCKKHPNPIFQYSGYVMAMRYAMGTLKRDDRIAYDKLRKHISEGVQSDLKENRKYWSRFKNPFEKYSDRIYDQYLKANNQQAGIKSYSRMVRLLLWDYRKSDGAME